MENSLEFTLDEKLNLYADTRLRYEEKKRQFDKENEDLSDAMKELEKQIKAEVLNFGQTVRTDMITAVYKKGKESWDSTLLKGFAIAHPEILAAHKMGEPSVSFQLRKQV